MPDEWVEGSQPAFAAMLSLARVDSVTYSREDPKAVANFSLGLTIKRYNLVSQHTFTDPYAYCLDFVDTIGARPNTDWCLPVCCLPLYGCRQSGLPVFMLP